MKKISSRKKLELWKKKERAREKARKMINKSDCSKTELIQNDPRQETVIETIVRTSRYFAARGVFFFAFCIFINVINMIFRGKKG